MKDEDKGVIKTMTNTMDNEYEQIRAQRMSRNADMLKQLKVERIATTLKASARSSIAPCVDGKGQARVSFPRKKRGRYSYSKAAHANIVVGMRKSRRIRGEKAGEGELENDNPNVEGQRISGTRIRKSFCKNKLNVRFVYRRCPAYLFRN